MSGNARQRRQVRRHWRHRFELDVRPWSAQGCLLRRECFDTYKRKHLGYTWSIWSEYSENDWDDRVVVAFSREELATHFVLNFL